MPCPCLVCASLLQRIVSTSFDDTLKIWQVPNTAGGTGKKASAAEEPACITMKHDNQTGRYEP